MNGALNLWKQVDAPPEIKTKGNWCQSMWPQAGSAQNYLNVSLFVFSIQIERTEGDKFIQ